MPDIKDSTVALAKIFDQLKNIPEQTKTIGTAFDDVFKHFDVMGKKAFQNIFNDIIKSSEEIKKAQMGNVQYQMQHYKKLINDAKEASDKISKFQKTIFDDRIKMLQNEMKHLKVLSTLPDEIAKHFENARGKIGAALGGIGVAKGVATDLGIDIPGMTVAVEALKGASQSAWGVATGAAYGILKEYLAYYKELNKSFESLRNTTMSMKGAFGQEITGKNEDFYQIAGENVKSYNISVNESEEMMKSFAATGIEPTNENLETMNSLYFSLTKTMNVSGGTFNKIGGIIKKDFGLNLENAAAYWDQLQKAAKDSHMPLDTVANDLSGLTQKFRDTGISINTMTKMYRDNISAGMSYSRNISNIEAMYGGITGADVGHAAFYGGMLDQTKGMSPEAAAMQIKFGGLGNQDISNIMKGTAGKMGVNYEELMKGDKGSMTKGEQLSAVFKMQGLTGISGARFMEKIPGLLTEQMKASKKEKEDIVNDGKKRLEVLGGMRSNLTKIENYTWAIKAKVTGKGGQDIAQELKDLKQKEKEDKDRAVLEEKENVKKAEKDAENIKKRKQAEDYVPKKHSGGYIANYDNGGPIIQAERGEFMMRKEAVQKRGIGFMDNINQGGTGGSGGTNINVSVNIPVLKQVIEEAITRLFRERPQLALMG